MGPDDDDPCRRRGGDRLPGAVPPDAARRRDARRRRQPRAGRGEGAQPEHRHGGGGGGLLVARREIRLPERVKTYAEPAPPPARITWLAGAAAVAAAVVVSRILSPYQLVIGSKALVFAALTISLVLLTGLSGQVSLMQMSFAGLGAVILAALPSAIPWIIGVGIAALAAGVLGGLVALPALRLRGLYLGLLTLAFAILMDNLVFGNRH